MEHFDVYVTKKIEKVRDALADVWMHFFEDAFTFTRETPVTQCREIYEALDDFLVRRKPFDLAELMADEVIDGYGLNFAVSLTVDEGWITDDELDSIIPERQWVEMVGPKAFLDIYENMRKYAIGGQK